MKIIAVNINKAMVSTPKLSVLDATKRAWKLNINRCKDYDYIIGVDNGNIKSFFRKTGEHIDSTQPSRVEFYLTPCNDQDEKLIRDYCKNISLKFITTKYID